MTLPDPPSDRQMDRLASVVAPLARVTQPMVLGIENVSERPVLFVGNHTRFGLIDVPFMMAELWTRRRVRVRALGDHGHYAVPVWRNLLELSGMVRGTRDNVRALMRDGQHILVFPGGSGEVFKGRGLRYQLIWKERLGFARLAIEFGYPILPFAAVGADDMFDVVADSTTPVAAQVSSLMRRLVGLPLPPLARGIGPTLIPRPERLYFWFGEPIETTRHAGRLDDDEPARAVRDEARSRVEHGIQILLAERERDPRRGLAARLRGGPELPPPVDSDPGAALVRRAFDSWNTAGSAGVEAWLSTRVVLEDPPDWPDRDVWRGREAVVARLEDVTTTLGAAWADVSDARTIRDGVLLVSFTLRAGEGVAPGPDAEGGFHGVVELAGEEITRLRIFRTESEAHAAASSSRAT